MKNSRGKIFLPRPWKLLKGDLFHIHSGIVHGYNLWSIPSLCQTKVARICVGKEYSTRITNITLLVVRHNPYCLVRLS